MNDEPGGLVRSTAAEGLALATAGEVADALHISRPTLRRWADAGRIAFVRTPGGHRRYPLAEVSRLKRELAGREDTSARPPAGRLPRLADLLEQEGAELFGKAREELVARWGTDPRRRAIMGPLLESMTAATRSGRYEPLRRHMLGAMRHLLLHGAPYVSIARLFAALELVVYGRLIELGRRGDADGWRVLIAYLREAVVEEFSGTADADEPGWRSPWRVLEISPKPFAVLDYTGRMLALNPPAERLLGRRAGQVTGRDVLELLPPRLHGPYREALNARSPLGLLAWTGELFPWAILRPDGSEVPVELTTAEFGVSGGDSVALIEIRDLTEEQAGAVRRRHLQALVEACGSAMWSSDERLEIVSWNPAAERLLGWTAEEIVGRPLATIVPPERYYELHEMYARVLGHGSVDDEPVVRLHRDGRLVDVRIAVTPIRERGVVVGMATVARSSAG